MRAELRIRWMSSMLLVVLVAMGAAGAQRTADRTAVPLESPKAHDLKITVLSSQVVEGLAGHGEWGFAALVEADGRKLLFDTGTHPNTVLDNAKTLGIDLTEIEDVVLSHNHGDHTGGLLSLRRAVMSKNPRALARVFVAPGIFATRRGNPPAWMPADKLRREFEALGGEFVVLDQPKQVLPGIWLTGPVPRRHDERTYPLGTVEVELDGKWQTDKVPEDMALVAVTADGVFLLSGCGHSGIVNNVLYARKLAGQPVRGAVGGFHLFQYSEKELEWTAAQLREAGLQTFSGAHCTGLEATMNLRRLMNAPAGRVYISGVGSVFRSTTGGARDPRAKF